MRVQCRRNDIVTEELDFTPDEIGEWSERKIRIVARHAEAYSKILAKQNYLKHFYIDGFCGGGIAVRKGSRDHVLTTARRILAIKPPFTGYHMIDADAVKAQHAVTLNGTAEANSTVRVSDGTTSLGTAIAWIEAISSAAGAT